MYTPQQSARILMLRRKVDDGTITQEELREGLALLQEARAGAHAASAASKERKATKTAKANINSDDLLGELGAL